MVHRVPGPKLSNSGRGTPRRAQERVHAGERNRRRAVVDEAAAGDGIDVDRERDVLGHGRRHESEVAECEESPVLDGAGVRARRRDAHGLSPPLAPRDPGVPRPGPVFRARGAARAAAECGAERVAPPRERARRAARAEQRADVEVEARGALERDVGAVALEDRRDAQDLGRHPALDGPRQEAARRAAGRRVPFAHADGLARLELADDLAVERRRRADDGAALAGDDVRAVHALGQHYGRRKPML